MDIFSVFTIIILAAAIQATFQVSVSVFVLLSGHKISQKSSHRHLMKLSTAMVLGVFFTSTLLFCAAAFIASNFTKIFAEHFRIIWAAAIGLLSGLAVSNWLFYYKRSKESGTEIWLPRSFANYLSRRTSVSSHAAEAFSLGVSGILAEIIFILPPLITATLATSMLTAPFQFVALVAFVFVSNFPLFVVYCVVSGGHSLSEVQMWRERNQKFLKLFASLGAIILSVVIFTTFFEGKL